MMKKAIEMRPFTRLDWSAWSGAEGKDPLIAEIESKESSDGYNSWTFIADDMGAGAYPYREDVPDDMRNYVLDLPNKEVARAVIESIDPNKPIIEQLLKFGFQEMEF
jgi:hypothetical protein